MKKKIPILIIIIASVIFLSIPLVSISKSIKLRKNGVFSESTVIERSTSSKGLSKVTVTFNTTEGKQVTAKATKRYFVSEIPG